MKSDSKILIVEDEPILQLMLIHMLERMGCHHFKKTATGTKAIELCTTNNFDLILMDITLQGEIDGIETYKQIKEKKGPIPIVYISGNTDPKNKERANLLGYNHFLSKPLTFSQLKTSVGQILEKK